MAKVTIILFVFFFNFYMWVSTPRYGRVSSEKLAAMFDCPFHTGYFLLLCPFIWTSTNLLESILLSNFRPVLELMQFRNFRIILHLQTVSYTEVRTMKAATDFLWFMDSCSMSVVIASTWSEQLLKYF